MDASAPAAPWIDKCVPAALAAGASKKASPPLRLQIWPRRSGPGNVQGALAQGICKALWPRGRDHCCTVEDIRRLRFEAPPASANATHAEFNALGELNT